MTDSEQTEVGAKVVLLFNRLMVRLGVDPKEVEMTDEQKVKVIEQCMLEVGLNFLSYVENKDKRNG